MVEVTCCVCGKKIIKATGEYNRRIKKGQKRFFCSAKCVAVINKEEQTNPIIIRICPVCGKEFESKIGKHDKTFCSRSCASKGSVNEKRRAAGRYAASINFPERDAMEQMRLCLLGKESWKYSDLKAFLEFINEQYEFEHIVDKFIYDLFLPNRNIVVEFDGKEHKKLDESEKEKAAENAGYTLVRKEVSTRTVYSPSLIYDILK